MALEKIRGLRVLSGSNTIASCYQFVVKDLKGAKILTIKLYDKVLDLVGREYRHPVGSRISQILGSKSQLTTFDRRVRASQHVGLSRVELSINREAIEKYNPFSPSVKTVWH